MPPTLPPRQKPGANFIADFGPPPQQLTPEQALAQIMGQLGKAKSNPSLDRIPGLPPMGMPNRIPGLPPMNNSSASPSGLPQTQPFGKSLGQLIGGGFASPQIPQVNLGQLPEMGNVVNNQQQVMAPQAPAQAPVAPGGFDFAKIIEALNAPHGRHLGIGGAEMTQANPMGNFGGDPFTNGFFSQNQQPDYRPGAAYHPPTMPQQNPFMPFQGDQAPTPGSPVYQQQHPDQFQMGIGMPPFSMQPRPKATPFSFGMLPRR